MASSLVGEEAPLIKIDEYYGDPNLDLSIPYFHKIKLNQVCAYFDPFDNLRSVQSRLDFIVLKPKSLGEALAMLDCVLDEPSIDQIALDSLLWFQETEAVFQRSLVRIAHLSQKGKGITLLNPENYARKQLSQSLSKFCQEQIRIF